MPGPRMTTDALKARGKKHLSNAEEAARRSGELNIAPAQKAKPPKWLPEGLKKSFRALGKQLIDVGLYTDLDADTLGRYLVAQLDYVAATEQLHKALTADELNLDDVDAWGKIQERHFKQARACANDMGLTVTSRCRLVVPKPEEAEVDEFTAFLNRRAAGG